MIDRWRVFLQSYDYEIEHRPGKYLFIEDGLSRSINFMGISAMDIKEKQKEDTLLEAIKAVLQNKAPLATADVEEQARAIILKNKENIIINDDDDSLYYIKTNKKQHYNLKRIIIPQQLQNEIIKSFHDAPTSGHLATEKTFWKISKDFWFPDMYNKIEKYCKNCTICEKNRKFFKVNDNLHPIEVNSPLELIEMDHCGPFISTLRGNQYVLTIIDHFTKKRWFIPVKSTSAEETFQALLDNVCTCFDFPTTILTDRGSAFTSKIAEEFNKITNTTPTFALTNQHNTVGAAEKSNQLMEDIVRKFVDKYKQDDWDLFVRLAAYAINKTISDAHKYAPDYLIFGKNSINQIIKEHPTHTNMDQYTENFTRKLQKAINITQTLTKNYQNKMIKQRKQKLGKRKSSEFKKGDVIYIQKKSDAVIKDLSHKLDERALGPFKINDLDDKKGNIKVQIAPNTEIDVKKDDVRKANNQQQNLDELYETKTKNYKIIPTKPTEVVVLSNPADFPVKGASLSNHNKGKIPEKSKYNSKDLVGKRVNIEWKSGQYKGWHKGTIIGFTSNLVNNLIYYDQRNNNVDPAIDYYSQNLLAGNTNWRMLN